MSESKLSPEQFAEPIAREIVNNVFLNCNVVDIGNRREVEIKSLTARIAQAVREREAEQTQLQVCEEACRAADTRRNVAESELATLRQQLASARDLAENLKKEPKP